MDITRRNTMNQETTSATPCTSIDALRAAAAELLKQRLAIKDDPPESLDKISSLRYPEGDESARSTPDCDSEREDLRKGEGTDQVMKKQADLAGQLRKAVNRSGLTRNQIAKQTDLSYSVVHGFMAGRDIQLSTASKIAAVVGIELTAQRKTKAR